MKISLIAAVGNSGQIGLNGQLPWHEPDDLKWFRKMTTGSVMIAGYRTYQSVRNVIDLELSNRYLVCDNKNLDIHELERLSNMFGLRDVFIIGGAKTYTKWMPYVDRSYISNIDYDGPADTYFPGYKELKL